MAMNSNYYSVDGQIDDSKFNLSAHVCMFKTISDQNNHESVLNLLLNRLFDEKKKKTQ